METFPRCALMAIVLVVGLIVGCRCDTYRIGRRVKGDQTILKKILLSVPTAQPTNHTVIYEYRATNAVSCIEYQVENIADEELVKADIAFTGEYSIEAKFHIFNITELVIVMSIYGFDRFSVPMHFQPILVPQFLLAEDNAAPKFGLGFRRDRDELIYFATQTTTRTKTPQNHSLTFDASVEHFITYVSVSVESKTAGVTFVRMNEHEFSGIVYDVHSEILFANLYVYGFKKEKLPDDYQPVQPINAAFDPNEIITLKGAFSRSDLVPSGAATTSQLCDWFGLVLVLWIISKFF